MMLVGCSGFKLTTGTLYSLVGLVGGPVTGTANPVTGLWGDAQEDL